jgi:hypothetical protein
MHTAVELQVYMYPRIAGSHSCACVHTVESHRSGCGLAKIFKFSTVLVSIFQSWVWVSAHPLYLEDDNIFEKSATLLQIPSKFRLVPTWPIWIRRLKRNIFPRSDRISQIAVGVGELFVWDPAIQTGSIQPSYSSTNWRFWNVHNFLKTLVWHSFYCVFWNPWADPSFADSFRTCW